jgi:hypothetical protein
LSKQTATTTTQSTSSERENQELWVTIIQVLPQGVLAEGQIVIRAADGHIRRASSKKVFFVQGFTGGLAEGESFRVQAYADGTYTYEDASGGAGLWRSGYSPNSLNTSNN